MHVHLYLHVHVYVYVAITRDGGVFFEQLLKQKYDVA